MNLTDVTYLCLWQIDILPDYLTLDEFFNDLGIDVVYFRPVWNSPGPLNDASSGENLGNELHRVINTTEPFIVLKPHEFTPDAILDELRPFNVYPSLNSLSADTLTTGETLLTIELRE